MQASILFLGAFVALTTAQWAIDTASVYPQAGTEGLSWLPETNSIFFTSSADNIIRQVELLENSSVTLVREYSVNDIGSPTYCDSIYIPEEDNTLLAVSVTSFQKTDPGYVAFFNLATTARHTVRVGALPDNLRWTPDKTHLVIANEGEPDDTGNDPVGSISIIPVSTVAEAFALTDSDVKYATFDKFTSVPPGMVLVSPFANLQQNIEPEYVTFASGDSSTAYVTLQENNGIAVVNVATASVERLIPLDFTDRGQIPFDASDRDNLINIRTWENVVALRRPDALGAIDILGERYIVTANEGDAMDYTYFSEEIRGNDLSWLTDLNHVSFPNSSILDDDQLGRLKLSNVFGKEGFSNTYTTLFHIGGRSITVVREDDGVVVGDSGSQIEEYIAAEFAFAFNTQAPDVQFDIRSDDKGIEIEGMFVDYLEGVPYAFAVFERFGGVAMFNLCTPSDPILETYYTNRVFENSTGDWGPEDVILVKAADSPTGKNILIISNEFSGSLAIYELSGQSPFCANIEDNAAPASLVASSLLILAALFKSLW